MPNLFRLAALALPAALMLLPAPGALAAPAPDTTTDAAQTPPDEATAREELDAAIAAHGADSFEAAVARVPLAAALSALGRSDEMLEQLQLCYDTLRKLEGPRAEVTLQAAGYLTGVLDDMATARENDGDYAGAEPLIDRYVEVQIATYGEGGREAIAARRRLGTNIKMQGRPQDAEPILRHALDMAKTALGADDQLTTGLMNDVARAIEKLGKLKDAEALYRGAYEASSRKVGKDDRETLVYEQNLGAILLYQQRLDEAEPVIRDTLERRRRALGADDKHTIYSMTDLASLLMVRGDPAAGPIWADALARAERVLGEDSADAVNIRNSYALWLMQSGNDASLALGEATKATDAIIARRSAVGLDARGQRTLSTFTEEDAFYFEVALNAAWRKANLPDLPPGFSQALTLEATTYIQEAMESPANTAVIRRAAERAAETKGPELAALARKREALSDNWAQLAKAREALLAGNHDPAALAKASADLAAAEKAIAAIDTEMKAKFPEFFDMLRPQPIYAPDIFQLLKGTNDAVLIVLPTLFGTHSIAISADDINWNVSKIDTPTINAAVRRLRWDLGADVAVTAEEDAAWSDEGEGAYPFDRATAFGIYRQFVAPVEGVLAGKRHVYVVAGGSLSSLPFSVLVTEPPTGQDGNPDDLRATKWLADKYALVQLPSVQSLVFLRAYAGTGKSAADARAFLGFGDPALDGVAQQRGGGKGRRGGGTTRDAAIADVWQAGAAPGAAPSVNLAALRKLARLPGTAIELDRIRAVLKAPASAVMTGKSATEATVKHTDLTHAGIIAFATHGVLAGEIDGMTEPGLVFTPPAVASSDDDGLLTMSEIAGLRMKADWVILSACNTAAGDGSQGATGLSGLAKAFFFAGAKSLLASHWPVRDDVAARLTVRAIDIADANPDLSRAEALQRAMREIRMDKSHDTADDTWAHPNAWAPFTLIGDASGR